MNDYLSQTFQKYRNKIGNDFSLFQFINKIDRLLSNFQNGFELSDINKQIHNLHIGSIDPSYLQEISKNISDDTYDCVQEMNRRMAIYQVVPKIIVLIANLMLLANQPLTYCFITNFLYDFSTIILIAILILYYLMLISQLKIDDSFAIVIIFGYIQKCFFIYIVNFFKDGLFNENNKFIVMISILQSLPFILNSFASENNQKVKVSTYALLLFCIYHFMTVTDADLPYNRTLNYHAQIALMSILVYHWIRFRFCFQYYKIKLCEKNIQCASLMRTIEENEIHGASLVHELRNPLNSMMGSITLLEKTLPLQNIQTTELFQIARCCGEHLHTLIGNLLEFSKLKAKKIELNKTQVDLKGIVRKVVKMNYFKAKEKANQLNFYVSQNFPRKVIADEQRINQILINLISNAIKFTQKGNVSVYLGWRGYTHKNIVQESSSNNDAPSQTLVTEEGSIHYQEDRHLFKHLNEDRKGSGINGEGATTNGDNDSSSVLGNLIKVDSHVTQLYGNNFRINSNENNDNKQQKLSLSISGTPSRNYYIRSQSQYVNNQGSPAKTEKKLVTEESNKAQKDEYPHRLISVEPQQFGDYMIAQIIQNTDPLIDVEVLNSKKYFQHSISMKEEDKYPNFEIPSPKVIKINNQSLLRKSQIIVKHQDKDFFEIDNYLLGDQQNQNLHVQDEFVQFPSVKNVQNHFYDENITFDSSRQSDLKVRDVIHKRTISTEQDKNLVIFGTPRNRNLISETERNIIERVVSKHINAAANEDFNMPQYVDNLMNSRNNEEETQREGIVEEEQTLMSCKAEFDQVHGSESFNLKNKFLDLDLNLPRHKRVQSYQERILIDQQRINRKISYEDSKHTDPKNVIEPMPAEKKILDDNELLKRSILQTKKHFQGLNLNSNTQLIRSNVTSPTKVVSDTRSPKNFILKDLKLIEAHNFSEPDNELMEIQQNISSASIIYSQQQKDQNQQVFLVNQTQIQQSNDDQVINQTNTNFDNFGQQKQNNLLLQTPKLQSELRVSRKKNQKDYQEDEEEKIPIQSTQSFRNESNSGSLEELKIGSKQYSNQSDMLRIKAMEEHHLKGLNKKKSSINSAFGSVHDLQNRFLFNNTRFKSSNSSFNNCNQDQILDTLTNAPLMDQALRQSLYHTPSLGPIRNPDIQCMMQPNETMKQGDRDAIPEKSSLTHSNHEGHLMLEGRDREVTMQNIDIRVSVLDHGVEPGKIIDTLHQGFNVNHSELQNIMNSFGQSHYGNHILNNSKEEELVVDEASSSEVESRIVIKTYHTNENFETFDNEKLVNQVDFTSPDAQKQLNIIKLQSTQDPTQPVQTESSLLKRRMTSGFTKRLSLTLPDKPLKDEQKNEANPYLMHKTQLNLSKGNNLDEAIIEEPIQNSPNQSFRKMKRFSNASINKYITHQFHDLPMPLTHSQSNNTPDLTQQNLNVNVLPELGVLEIKVMDSGIGISEEGIKRLFQPYSQANNKISKQFGGTGLGLCICQELVSIMNGKIQISSELGKGTTFTVHIPLEVSAELTQFVEEAEFDQEMLEIDVQNYEFAVCNNNKSFGIQQIRKYLVRKESQIYFKEPIEFQSINERKIFKQDKSFKAFIVDYLSIRNNSWNLLQKLSNYYDSIEYNANSDTSPILRDKKPIAKSHYKVKVPVIVLISPFMDESRVRKSDNIFVLRVPFDAKSMKKILIFLKRYYRSCIAASLNIGLPIFADTFEFKSQQQPELNKNSSLIPELSSLPSGASSQLVISGQPKNSGQLDSRQSSQMLQDQLSSPNRFRRSTLQDFRLMPVIQTKSPSEKPTLYSRKINSNQNKTQINIIEEILNAGRPFAFPSQDQTLTLQLKQTSQPQYVNHVPLSVELTKIDESVGGKSNESVRKTSFASNQTIRLEQPKTMQETFGSSPQHDRQRALVVNDDQFSRKITSLLLDMQKQELGKQFDILNASNGEEALMIYKNIPNIKLIMMDIEMPIMDGYKATQKIREYEEEVLKNREGQCLGSSMTYIIGVSGNSTAEHFRKCQQVGMNEAVIVPIQNQKISELIQKIF